LHADDILRGSPISLLFQSLSVESGWAEKQSQSPRWPPMSRPGRCSWLAATAQEADHVDQERPGDICEPRDACWRRSLARHHCIRLRDHYGNGRLSPGPVSETNRPYRALPCVNMFGVVVIGIQIRGLSSCSGGTSPKAPGRSNDASVERAPRRRDRPARTNSGRDRENVGAQPRRNCRPLKRNPRPIIRGLRQIPFTGDRVLRSRAGRLARHLCW
jgi:hypothetical protein